MRNVGIGVAAELYGSDVLEMKQRSVRLGAKYDIAKLCGCRKLSLSGECELKVHISACGGCADTSRRHLKILRLNHLHDIRRSESAHLHLVRVKPYTHAVFTAAKCSGSANTVYTREFVNNIKFGIIGQIQSRIVVLSVTLESDKQQYI